MCCYIDFIRVLLFSTTSVCGRQTQKHNKQERVQEKELSAETCIDHVSCCLQIKDLGVKAGVVLNPATPLESIQHVLHQVDLILLMSGEPLSLLSFLLLLCLLLCLSLLSLLDAATPVNFTLLVIVVATVPVTAEAVPVTVPVTVSFAVSGDDA